MKKLTINTFSWILIVLILSLYLQRKLNFPLNYYIFIIGISLVIFGIFSVLKSIFGNSKYTITNKSEILVCLKNTNINTISICLAGLISLLTGILL